MTAYVNEEQKKEGAYGKAVKATLAATLAAGMVPAAAAFADEPQAETASEGDIELLLNDYATDFANGKVTKAVDQDGNELKVDKDGNIVIKAGSVTTVYVQEYTTSDGVIIELGEGACDAGKWQFSASPAGWGAEKFNEPGEYKGFKITMTDGGDYNNCQSSAFGITIEKGELDGFGIYNKDNNAKDDVTKTSFVYNAGKLNAGIAKDGAVSADATIAAIYAADDIACQDDLSGKAVLPAGNYNVKLVGAASYNTGSVKFVPVSVSQFDVSASDLTISDRKATSTDALEITSPSGSVPDAVKKELKASGDKVINGAGAYSVTIAAADAENKNIVNSKKVDFVVADKLVSDLDITYTGDAAWTDGIETVISAEDVEYFDASKVVVKDGATTLKQGEDYELVVTDENGKAATLDDLKKPGSWKVFVKCIPGDDYAYAGMSAAKDVTVTAGELSNAAVSIYYKDKMVSQDFSVDYADGKNVLDDIDIVVKDGNGKVLTEDVDYKVVVKKAGKDVTEIVDKGEYVVKVEGIGYTFAQGADTDIKITVQAISATPVLANEQEVIVKGEKDTVPGTANGANDTADAVGVPYTGQAIVPVMKYDTGEKDAKGDAVYAELPAEAYEYVVTDAKGKVVDQIVDPGTYTLRIKDAKADDNWTVVSTGMTMNVIDDKYFLDVPSTEWYYMPVNEAFENGWVKGYNASDFFGPNDSITRADVCVIVARMAGVDLQIDHENWGSEVDFYETPFADVDGHMYYAQAIAWAANTGIVQGDGNTGNFRPTDEISRSEFAAIMMRYAQKAGDDTVVEEGALDGYADASEVPAWFQGEVAWAVEAGIMGVGTPVLNPNGDISRAEVAAMAVRL